MAKIKQAKCFCSKTNRSYMLQFVNETEKSYVLQGSFVSFSAEEPEKLELNGKFSIGSNYCKTGCPLCKNTGVAVCRECHTFFCYSGKKTERLVCPSCKRTVSVAAMANNTITYTERKNPLEDENSMVLLVLDFSGSMRQDVNGNETNDAQDTKFAKVQESLLSEIVENRHVKCKLGLVYFNNDVEYKIPMTSKRDKIKSELKNLTLKPKYNNAANPIKVILTDDEFKDFRNANCSKLILLYSDGHFNRPQGMPNQAKTLAGEFGIEIIAIGSPDADKELMNKISTSGVGKVVDYRSLKKTIEDIVANGGSNGQ